MSKRINVSILPALLLLGQTAVAEPVMGDLTISVIGFSDNSGQVVANLFRKDDDVMKPDTAYMQTRGKISGKQAKLVFRNLKYGKYAVSVFHDENGNNVPDHNLLNFPAEPLGFSNQFHLGVFSGLPNFEKLQFDFSPETETVSIMVQ